MAAPVVFSIGNQDWICRNVEGFMLWAWNRVVVETTTPHRSSSSGKWWNPAVFYKPYSSILLWIVHLETPNISPILIQLNPNSSNSFNISPGMSKRGLPGVSFSSCPGAKQFSATVSGMTGQIAMWWFWSKRQMYGNLRDFISIFHWTYPPISLIDSFIDWFKLPFGERFSFIFSISLWTRTTSFYFFDSQVLTS